MSAAPSEARLVTSRWGYCAYRMAPLPDVSGALRARLLFTIGGKADQGLRVFYAYTGGVPNLAAVTAFANALMGDAVTNLPAVMHPNVVFTGVEMTDLSSPLGAVYTATTDTPGTEDGDPLPAGSAVIAAYQIARRYRGGHPRSYWPLGTAADLTSDQDFASGSVTDFYNAIQPVLASIVGLSSGSTTVSGQINVSYFEGFTSVENPLTHRYRNVPTLRPTPVQDGVEDIIIRAQVGSMRKRRIKPV